MGTLDRQTSGGGVGAEAVSSGMLGSVEIRGANAQ